MIQPIWLLMVCALILKRDQRAMTSLPLLKCTKELWLQKAEVESLKKVISLECNSDSQDDESKEVYAAEFVWPSKVKSYACSLLLSQFKKIAKRRNLLSMYPCVIGYLMNYIRMDTLMSHSLLLLEELTRRAFCKWHNSFFMVLTIAMFSLEKFNRP